MGKRECWEAGRNGAGRGDFSPPQRCAAGAAGQPGRRSWYTQGSNGSSHRWLTSCRKAAVVKSKSEGQSSHSKQLIPSVLFVYFHCGHCSFRNRNRSADGGIAWEGSRVKGQPRACRQRCGPSGHRPGDSCVGGCRKAVLVLCCAGSAYSLCAEHQQQLRERTKGPSRHAVIVGWRGRERSFPYSLQPRVRNKHVLPGSVYCLFM